MKINMYELLGLIKDNKAPKKVIYEDELLFYDSIMNDYYNYDGNHSLFHGVSRWLDDKVEIIEDIPKEETNVSEEQLLFNSLTTIDQEYVITIMKMLKRIDNLKNKGDE